MRNRTHPAPARLVVGIAESPRVVCVEGRHERLLASLALHELDLVLSDATTPPGLGTRAFHHLLGECGVTFFAAPEVAERLSGEFPGCLGGAPMLVPTEDSALRRSFDLWCAEHAVRPSIVGEFAAPSVIENEIERQHGARIVGRAQEIRERYFAISAERKLRHPAVVALSEAARTRIFGAP